MSISDLTLKAQLGPPSSPAKIVKPRKPAHVNMRIIVCDDSMDCWYEDMPGNKSYRWELTELIRWLRDDNWPRDIEGKRRTTPIMLVCHNPHRVFQAAHNAFKDDPEWNARFSVNTAERFHMDGKMRESKVKTTQDIRISFFGFRNKDRKTQYFHPISPHDFMDNFDEYGNSDWPNYIRLYHWGGSVRKWIKKHRLRFSVTRGGLSAQLLRDKQFYPDSRRKLPKETNEKARPAMPGNFYAMHEHRIGQIVPAVFLIDQENAHHYAAETVQLPNSDSLFARGRFAMQSDEPYVRNPSLGFQNLISEIGLFRCRVWIPKALVGMLPTWAANGHGVTSIYLFSNELDLARELGIEIRHISYAWTSREIDTGLAKYAQWAQAEVKAHSEHRSWLKPMLLSAYGILGTRPRHMEMAYWRSQKGEQCRYLLGPTPINMYKNRTKKRIQPVIANTIHRGMIEAETRKLSIELARRLEVEGHTIIAIHADAVLVKDEGQQLPLLPPPWRVKDRLHSFKATDRVSYESETVQVMPGRRRNAKR